MHARLLLLIPVLLAAVLTGGCSIKLGPQTTDLRTSINPPVVRLDLITEQKSGSGADEWTGVRELLKKNLGKPPASGIFTKDNSGLAMRIDLSSSHESDTSRLIGLGLLSIGTLGIIPLHYHSDWPVAGDVTVRSDDGTVHGRYEIHSTATYDIQAYPLTMFSLFGGSLRGDADGKKAIQLMADDLAAQIVRAVDADYPRLAAAYRSGTMEAKAGTGAPVSAREVLRAVKSDVDDLPAPKAKPNRKAYAIVVGIETYRQKLPRADYATHDAQAVTDYLTKVLGYPEENVITLLNDKALKSDFEKYFEKWLGNNVEKGSTVFVYYSGHGAPDQKTGTSYLVPHDGDPAFISETGYPLKRMYDALGKLPAREVSVVLDSCFSGAGGRSVIAQGSRPLVLNLATPAALPANLTVLAASADDQTSSTYGEKGHGLFTYFLLKGIKNEDVTRPDGTLSLTDLYEYLKPQVERIARKQFNNEQSPRLIAPK